MEFWDKITGRDMNKQWKAFESRAKKLPADYQAAWQEINGFLWQRSDFTGRNIMHILEGVLELFEEAGSEGRSAQEVLGGDVKGFCAALAGEEGAKSFRDKWRDQLNRSVLRKLGR
ncbi:MAG: DUF1048 domain-containing protein [Christensenella sp.]